MPKKRTQGQLQRDREIVKRYMLQGYTQAEVADMLNSRPDVDYQISQQTVSNDWKYLQELWKEDVKADIDELKRKEADYLEMLFLEAMEGWRESQKEVEESMTKMYRKNRQRDSDRSGVDKTEHTSRTKQQIGDVRFLTEAREVRADIRDLFGLNEAQKIDMSARLMHPADLDPETEARLDELIGATEKE